MLTQLVAHNQWKTFFCHPRTERTVNIYSVAGQAEEQSQFSLIFLWSSTGESKSLETGSHPGSSVDKSQLL